MSGLSGCGSDTTETVEECVERFVNTQNELMRVRGGEWQPIFTYDIGQAKEFTDKLMAYDGGDMHVTIVSGRSGRAVEEFYKSDVPPGGVLLLGDDIALFRTIGVPGSRNATVAAGCELTPEKARLAHIAWTAVPPKADI